MLSSLDFCFAFLLCILGHWDAAKYKNILPRVGVEELLDQVKTLAPFCASASAGFEGLFSQLFCFNCWQWCDCCLLRFWFHVFASFFFFFLFVVCVRVFFFLAQLLVVLVLFTGISICYDLHVALRGRHNDVNYFLFGLFCCKIKLIIFSV